MHQHRATTVLHIDDDPIKRYTIGRLLRLSRFEVIEAESAERGLELAKTNPDVILLDVSLPERTGFDVCEDIKRNPSLAHIPILHISATYTHVDDKVRGLDSGADGYLIYPVDQHELAATINSLVRSRDRENLELSETRFRLLAENVRDYAIFIISTDGVYTSWNVGVERILGYSEQEWIGLPCSAIFTPEDQQNDLPAAELRVTAAAGRADDDRWHVRKNGTKFFASGVLARLLDTNGKLCGYVKILRDVTERKLLEDRQAALYQHEKRIADSLQRSILMAQDTAETEHLTTASFYFPASDEALVGGDFYDCFPVSDDYMALLVGDASGKGLEAATRTAEVKFALRAYLHEHLDPAKALYFLNRLICHTKQQDNSLQLGLVALSICLINVHTGEVRFCCAGSEPPAILRGWGDIEAITVRGLPLGAFEDVEYDTDQRLLQPGDIVALLTDGITEARDGHEFLDYSGFERLLVANKPAGDVHSIGAQVIGDARAFAGGSFQDDVCLLLAQWKEAPIDRAIAQEIIDQPI